MQAEVPGALKSQLSKLLSFISRISARLTSLHNQDFPNKSPEYVIGAEMNFELMKFLNFLSSFPNLHSDLTEDNFKTVFEILLGIISSKSLPSHIAW